MQESVADVAETPAKDFGDVKTGIHAARRDPSLPKNEVNCSCASVALNGDINALVLISFSPARAGARGSAHG